MKQLSELLKRLDGFKVIEANEEKMTLESPMGNLSVSWRAKVVSSCGVDKGFFPLQVILNICKNGVSVYHWGSMDNESNAKIIGFFQEKSRKDFLNKNDERKQTEKEIGLLLNL
jgi:hypothetical protein|tara:strand:- start:366 stop:707 length:342 start_codon:yes stop_codon:yes gene_type:complete